MGIDAPITHGIGGAESEPQNLYVQGTTEASRPEFNRARYLQKIDDVISGRHNYLDDNEAANYDAMFDYGPEPIFNNIWNRERGSGIGYIVFHDFLIKVGVGNTFVSTDFTGPGNKLVQKAVSDGIIEFVENTSHLAYKTRWKVISDPKVNLERIKNRVPV